MWEARETQGSETTRRTQKKTMLCVKLGSQTPTPSVDVAQYIAASKGLCLLKERSNGIDLFNHSFKMWGEGGAQEFLGKRQERQGNVGISSRESRGALCEGRGCSPGLQAGKERAVGVPEPGTCSYTPLRLPIQ